MIRLSTDIFHPLVRPATTSSNISSGIDDSNRRTEEDLPVGGLSLRHGFPNWFPSDLTSGKADLEGSSTAILQDGSRAGLGSKNSSSSHSMIDVLCYLRSAFDSEDVLDSIPLSAAVNPGAWHAWQAYRRKQRPLPRASAVPGDQPSQWNWAGVWEERVRRGVKNSTSDAALYARSGAANDLIHFWKAESEELDIIKDDIEGLISEAGT
ncbi:MAG: hypothetical protein M1823_004824 [Watsoniomyces obsoletus]|nr:MAG: hypothetical protein M1823_004824 [Watsoniomyces obsoletus]